MLSAMRRFIGTVLLQLNVVLCQAKQLRRYVRVLTAIKFLDCRYSLLDFDVGNCMSGRQCADDSCV